MRRDLLAPRAAARIRRPAHRPRVCGDRFWVPRRAAILPWQQSRAHRQADRHRVHRGARHDDGDRGRRDRPVGRLDRGADDRRHRPRARSRLRPGCRGRGWVGAGAICGLVSGAARHAAARRAFHRHARDDAPRAWYGQGTIRRAATRSARDVVERPAPYARTRAGLSRARRHLAGRAAGTRGRRHAAVHALRPPPLLDRIERANGPAVRRSRRSHEGGGVHACRRVDRRRRRAAILAALGRRSNGGRWPRARRHRRRDHRRRQPFGRTRDRTRNHPRRRHDGGHSDWLCPARPAKLGAADRHGWDYRPGRGAGSLETKDKGVRAQGSGSGRLRAQARATLSGSDVARSQSRAASVSASHGARTSQRSCWRRAASMAGAPRNCWPSCGAGHPHDRVARAQHGQRPARAASLCSVASAAGARWTHPGVAPPLTTQARIKCGPPISKASSKPATGSTAIR